MSFGHEYLLYLYGNRQNMEYELIPDDSSNSSTESSNDSSSSSMESWNDSSDSETRETPEILPPNDITRRENRQFEHPLQQSRKVSHNNISLYRTNRGREDENAGQIFLKRQNPSGSARTEEFASRKKYDMFAWLSSKHRNFPTLLQSAKETLSSIDRDAALPLATRYSNLKQAANLRVGVYRSKIHGRGLFSLVDMEAGEMVVEFVGEVIRSGVSDKREKYYREKGMDSYIFKLDDGFIIDGTMKGNMARFINHSCEANCYPEVHDIHGKQRIIIVALSSISALDEITLDYSFPSEKDRISCRCDSEGCRKFLN